jgi:hypothetical protein
VLIVIGIFTVLCSLLLPAVQTAREASRAVECRNHLRQLSLGLLSWMEVHKFIPRAATMTGGERLGEEPRFKKNWVVDLLPHIDQRVRADAWRHDLLLRDPENQQLADSHVCTLACPADISVTGRGDLSFAISAGPVDWMEMSAPRDGVRNFCALYTDIKGQMLDLNGDGVVCGRGHTLASENSELKVYNALSLLWTDHDGRNVDWSRRLRKGSGLTGRHRPASITDGMSNTLLFLENVRVGVDPSRPHTNWASAEKWQNRVFTGPGFCLDGECLRGQVDFTKANAAPFGINSGLRKPEGTSPFANSFHPGGVHVSLLDGSVRFLSESVDGKVYFDLFTPQGQRLTGTPFETQISELPF